jgi:hypothetical protein
MGAVGQWLLGKPARHFVRENNPRPFKSSQNGKFS